MVMHPAKAIHMNLADLGTRALLAGYAAKTFSPSEVMEAVIARVTTWEPRINALYAYDPDAARLAAAESTQRWANGTAGALDGVPVTIKELIATKGVPVPGGTAATQLVPAPADAPPAARLREAGAVIFAKTTAPDYGMLSSGLSSFHGTTRNPWDITKNPGGSSSGAAAAAAAGYGPLHVGTDIGGSIRLPSAWCGLVGFKPSFGRIPIDPYYVGRCAGPMTRSVDDAAYLMQVLSQPDARDATSLPPEKIDFHAAIDSVAGLRIGLMMQAGCGMEVAPEIADAVQRAARVFAEAGARVVDVKPVLTRKMLDGIDRFWRARSWDAILALPEQRRAAILPFIYQWAERGASVSGVQAVAGFNATYDIRRACAALFADVDVVLSPVTPNISFPAEYASPLNDPTRPFEHICFTLPWNMSEQPAISLNCGFSQGGMPIGLQIVARRFADWQTLGLARWFEARGGLNIPWPVI
jgi:aspartyl-tRNA(Asn)/glutamyl-tRNA(Gln) amidotransferase subunit A